MASNIIRVPIPIGTRGLNGSKDHTSIPIGSLIEANNVAFDRGSISKEGGCAKVNSTVLSGTPDVLGGWSFQPTAGSTSHALFTDQGDYLLDDDDDGVFDDGTGTGNKLSSGHSGTTAWFVEGGNEDASSNRKLFLFTGADPVQVIDGGATVSADISTPAADWSSSNQPSFGFIHEARLWGGGNANEPDTLYYSTATDHEDMTGSGSGIIQVYPGEGLGLIAGVVFQDFVFVFKQPRGIYIIDTRDTDTSNWRVQPFNRNIGIAGPHAFTLIDNDLLFLDRAGNFHLLSRTSSESFGAQHISDADAMGEWMRNNVNLAQLSSTNVIYYAAKQEVHCAVASAGSNVNDLRVVIDLNDLNTPRFRTSDTSLCTSLWERKDNDGILRPVAGGSDGFVRDLDQPTLTADGDGYTASFRTPNADFSGFGEEIGAVLSSRRKNGKYLDLIYEGLGNHNVSVDVYWDNVFHETIVFDMSGTGFLLGTDELDTGVLAEPAVLTMRKKLHGSGYRLSLRPRNSGANEDFSIQRVYVGCVLGNERINR